MSQIKQNKLLKADFMEIYILHIMFVKLKDSIEGNE